MLGVQVDPWPFEDLLEAVVARAAGSTSESSTVMYANVHVLNTAYHDSSLLEALRSASTWSQAQPVLGLWLKSLGGQAVLTRLRARRQVMRRVV